MFPPHRRKQESVETTDQSKKSRSMEIYEVELVHEKREMWNSTSAVKWFDARLVISGPAYFLP